MEGYYGNEEANFKHAVNSCRPMRTKLIGGTAACAAHILADQLGYMGSNLFAPFTKRRTGGLRLTRAMWPFPNFLCVWISCVVVFWNLHHAMPGNFDPLNPMCVLALWIGIPCLVFLYLQRRANVSEV